MEPGQHQQQEPKQQQQQHEDSNSSRSGFLCRQSSTRWIPTADQIRILKDIYYNNGITSPNADQIQKISARLRQYGKIEGKNVFYWFQNHKARERQKKKFSLDVAMQRSCCKPNDDSSSSSSFCSLPNKYKTTMGGFSASLPPPISSLSSPVVFAAGQMENIGCGSLLMEKSFRECSISGSGDGWMGVVPSCTSYAGKYIYSETLEGESPLMETLPLFPMNGQEDHGDDDEEEEQQQQQGKADKKKEEDCFPGFYGTAKAAETTLELSLSSNYNYYQGSLDHNST